MEQQPPSPSPKVYKPTDQMTPLEMSDEHALLRKKLEAEPDAITPSEIQRAVELTRALRRTATGPAKTRKKKSDQSLEDMLG